MINDTAESVLRDKARDAIAAGRLPTCSPIAVWGGPGSGQSCAVCAQVISGDGLGFELEFGPDDGVGPDVHNVHIWCFAAWEFECRRFLPAAEDDGTISPRERNRPHQREPG